MNMMIMFRKLPGGVVAVENFFYEALGGMPRIVISGACEVKLDGIGGIYLLTDTEIGFRCGSGSINVFGDGLSVLSLNGAQAAVGGAIRAVRLDKISGGNKIL